MSNTYFQFKQFTVHQQHCSMKVTTDSCLFGAWVAERLQNKKTVKHILDIGSGTGLLSLMLAQNTAANITGIELQQQDYLQSLQNAAASPWKENITMTHADVSHYCFDKKFEVIISNPPFYETDLRSSNTNKNIAHHSEGLTLDTLCRIIQQQLSPQGIFYLLLPAMRNKVLHGALLKTGLFINQVTFVHQTENHSAFRIMVEGSFSEGQQPAGKMMIKEKGVYSAAFVQLLKDYYLHL